MPETYRRKPKTIEVCRWTADNLDELCEFLGGGHVSPDTDMIFTREGPAFTFHGNPARVWVTKSQAWCDVFHGDGIAREPDGDGFYPIQAERLAEDFEREEDVEDVGRDDIFVGLTRAQWADVTGSIHGSHGEFCISNDECDCTELADLIETQVGD